MRDFNKFGVMVDCSRNAVPTIPALKQFFRMISDMGYNCAMLYTEDTYEIPSEPFFGYKRGRYTAAELKELDAYAESVGIELIPCIQTLAHLNAAFRWKRFKEIKDIDDILLLDEDRTYELIDKMFAAMSENIRSRTIHIGMDEAEHVGLGKYLQKHGLPERFDLLTRHLQKVCEIAAKYGYETLMWNDMFFKMVCDGKHIVSEKVTFPQEVLDQIPDNCSTVYWDYYSNRAEVYEAMCENSKPLGKEVWFAGGAWSWGACTPYNKLSIRRNQIAIPVCKEHEVKNVLLTMWGDDGGECSIFALLPALMSAAACAEEMSEEEMKAKFLEITGVSYDDMLLLDTPNYIYGDHIGVGSANYAKNRLYSDPFQGIPERNNEQPIDTAIFTQKACALQKAGESAGAFTVLFQVQQTLCEILRFKFDLSIRTREAYEKGDKEALRHLAEYDYDLILHSLEQHYEAYRMQWKQVNKPQGFEIQDIRLGGLMQRMKHCRRTLLEYCDGETDNIPELEEEILVHDEGYVGCWKDMVAAGIV